MNDRPHSDDVQVPSFPTKPESIDQLLGPIFEAMKDYVKTELPKPRLSVMALATSYEEWEGAEVFVQLKPGLQCQLTQLGRDEGIEAYVIEHEVKTEKGPVQQKAFVAVPYLTGRLRVVGALVEITYRMSKELRAVISLHPRDIQHVTRIERTLVRD